MSVIEDTRKLMQDFLAPELREISARLDALEKRFNDGDKRSEKQFDKIDTRFDKIDRRFDQIGERFVGIDKKIEDMDQRAQKRHEQVMSALNIATEFHALRERVARLESNDRPSQ